MTKPTTPPFRIKNVIKQQKNLHQQIGKLPVNYSQTQLTSLHNIINQTTKEITRLCQKHRVTPAALSKPSRKAYAWLKFLSELNYL